MIVVRSRGYGDSFSLRLSLVGWFVLSIADFVSCLVPICCCQRRTLRVSIVRNVLKLGLRCCCVASRRKFSSRVCFYRSALALFARTGIRVWWILLNCRQEQALKNLQHATPVQFSCSFNIRNQ